MKIVFASDSFKGSLSSAETAELLTKAANEVFGNAECVAVPIADGGEGTVDALIAAIRSRGYIQAKEGIALGDKETIALGDKEVLDCADAGGGAGLITVTVHGPLMEEIKAAYGRLNEKQAVIEMAAASGLTLVPAEKRNPLYTTSYGTGEDLEKVAEIDVSGLDERIGETKIIVACDVKNPLCGDNGATKTYGAQKGATPEIMKQL